VVWVWACPASKHHLVINLKAGIRGSHSRFLRNHDSDCAVRSDFHDSGAALLGGPNGSGNVGLRDAGGCAAHLARALLRLPSVAASPSNLTHWHDIFCEICV